MSDLTKRLWSLARRFWVDALLLAAIAAATSVAVRSHGKYDGPEGPLWLDFLIILGFWGPLFFRRRFPMGAPLAAVAVIAVTSLADHRFAQVEFAGYLTALGISAWFGMRPDRRQALVGLASLQAVSVIVNLNDPRNPPIGDYLWSAITFTIAWILGFALGGRLRETDTARRLAEEAEAEREEQARLAVAEERARIARELHDVVGHSVSVMTVQASAVRRLLEDDQEKEREALLVVEQTGREALAEMRRMVGVLRRPDEAPALAPQPSLEHIEKLVAHTRETGLPVDLRIQGTPTELPAGVDTTAYRIVQEALTNAAKHARASRAEVVVRYADDTVELTVTDDGRGGGDGGGSGHGLVGMRERVSVYGGELEAGPQAGGGFRLRATLPIT
jgi:signal transduction histidine kinase